MWSYQIYCAVLHFRFLCLFLGLSHQSQTTWMLESVHLKLSPGSLSVSSDIKSSGQLLYHPNLQNHCGGYILFSTSILIVQTVTMLLLL